MKKIKKQEEEVQSDGEGVDFDIQHEFRSALFGLWMHKDGFDCKIPDGTRDKMLKTMEKLRDNREDWPGFMYKNLEMRTRFVGKNLDLKKVDMNKIIALFGLKFVKITGFDTTSRQKTIAESTGEEEEE